MIGYGILIGGSFCSLNGLCGRLAAETWRESSSWAGRGRLEAIQTASYRGSRSRKSSAEHRANMTRLNYGRLPRKYRVVPVDQSGSGCEDISKLVSKPTSVLTTVSASLRGTPLLSMGILEAVKVVIVLALSMYLSVLLLVLPLLQNVGFL